MIKNKERDRESIGIIEIESERKDDKSILIELDFQQKTVDMYNLIVRSSFESSLILKPTLDIDGCAKTNESISPVKAVECIIYHDSSCKSSDYCQFLILEDCATDCLDSNESGVTTDDEDSKDSYDGAIFEMEL